MDLVMFNYELLAMLGLVCPDLNFLNSVRPSKPIDSVHSGMSGRVSRTVVSRPQSLAPSLILTVVIEAQLMCTR